MSNWSEENVLLLKKLWGSFTAREISEKMGPGFTRNSIIGKSSRLGLSAKLKTRSSISSNNSLAKSNKVQTTRIGKKNKFQSQLLDSSFEPAKNLSLEELTDSTCKYAESDPGKPDFSFCGRKVVPKFSYCPAHMMIIWQPKNKKEDALDSNEEVPKFIEKKIKSA
tara:strand:- start:347 stop:844 length:498 start_codon:yes stop_codon:yes gene_type:complete